MMNQDLEKCIWINTNDPEGEMLLYQFYTLYFVLDHIQVGQTRHINYANEPDSSADYCKQSQIGHLLSSICLDN